MLERLLPHLYLHGATTAASNEALQAYLRADGSRPSPEAIKHPEAGSERDCKQSIRRTLHGSVSLLPPIERVHCRPCAKG